jgi:AmmeMemoRadiSam system protein B
MRRGGWDTPLGTMSLDPELADALLDRTSDLEVDPEAHRLEHALEVQLPFIQHLTRSSRLRFVPIAVGTSVSRPIRFLLRPTNG